MASSLTKYYHASFHSPVTTTSQPDHALGEDTVELHFCKLGLLLFWISNNFKVLQHLKKKKPTTLKHIEYTLGVTRLSTLLQE